MIIGPNWFTFFWILVCISCQQITFSGCMIDLSVLNKGDCGEKTSSRTRLSCRNHLLWPVWIWRGIKNQMLSKSNAVFVEKKRAHESSKISFRVLVELKLTIWKRWLWCFVAGSRWERVTLETYRDTYGNFPIHTPSIVSCEEFVKLMKVTRTYDVQMMLSSLCSTPVVSKMWPCANVAYTGWAHDTKDNCRMSTCSQHACRGKLSWIFSLYRLWGVYDLNFLCGPPACSVQVCPSICPQMACIHPSGQ